MSPISRISIAAVLVAMAAQISAGSFELITSTDPGNSDDSGCAVKVTDIMGCTGTSNTFGGGDCNLTGEHSAEVCGSAAVTVNFSAADPAAGVPVTFANNAGNGEGCDFPNGAVGATCTAP
ncbi:MAG: membrane-bound alpha-1,6- mannosyltransferase Initiation-specific [Chaenotheca gracillima]|nr:MAG: membrane-bound alpha-1,6- mannosyltransferase Initiation-specific [Chaenotheca gracillima]